MNVADKLTVYYSDNGVFSDLSYECFDFYRDTFTKTIVTSEDAIYIGFFKPINAVYINITTANTQAGALTVSYYNGTSFTAVSDYYDETKNLTRSGFIQWGRNLEDEVVTTINSTQLFWYKVTSSVTTSATVFTGINIIFADDNDLKKEYFEISDLLPSGQASHILTHMSVRDHIINTLRRDGKYSYNSTDTIVKKTTPWDLLDFSEVRLAATYLALSKIFNNVSDQIDDVYRQKSSYYMSLFNDAMKVLYLSLDTDDDGVLDADEREVDNSLRLFRR